MGLTAFARKVKRMKALESLLTSIGLLLMRLGFGLTMLIAHGWPKLMGFSGKAATFPDPIGWGSRLSLMSAIGAEVVCSILLVLGLFTRAAAIPLAFTMFMAFFVHHASDEFADKELSLMYLFGYLGLAFAGGGMFALDRHLRRLFSKKKKK